MPGMAIRNWLSQADRPTSHPSIRPLLGAPLALSGSSAEHRTARRGWPRQELPLVGESLSIGSTVAQRRRERVERARRGARCSWRRYELAVAARCGARAPCCSVASLAPIATSSTGLRRTASGAGPRWGSSACRPASIAALPAVEAFPAICDLRACRRKQADRRRSPASGRAAPSCIGGRHVRPRARPAARAASLERRLRARRRLAFVASPDDALGAHRARAASRRRRRPAAPRSPATLCSGPSPAGSPRGSAAGRASGRAARRPYAVGRGRARAGLVGLRSAM